MPFIENMPLLLLENLLLWGLLCVYASGWALTYGELRTTQIQLQISKRREEEAQKIIKGVKGEFDNMLEAAQIHVKKQHRIIRGLLGALQQKTGKSVFIYAGEDEDNEDDPDYD